MFIINLTAVIVTVRDKNAARRGNWRTKERTLMLIAALGGAPAMYLTMIAIRHKTRKPLFMVGIPLIFLTELLILFLVLRYVDRLL